MCGALYRIWGVWMVVFVILRCCMKCWSVSILWNPAVCDTACPLSSSWWTLYMPRCSSDLNSIRISNQTLYSHALLLHSQAYIPRLAPLISLTVKGFLPGSSSLCCYGWLWLKMDRNTDTRFCCLCVVDFWSSLCSPLTTWGMFRDTWMHHEVCGAQSNQIPPPCRNQRAEQTSQHPYSIRVKPKHFLTWALLFRCKFHIVACKPVARQRPQNHQLTIAVAK
jgi:hypothetical protein